MRDSVLTGAPRAATFPINAMRNYLLACVQAEAPLALLANGCDLQMGCLRADQRNRDSLALDAIEPAAKFSLDGDPSPLIHALRAGRSEVPHPRHWETLQDLADS